MSLKKIITAVFILFNTFSFSQSLVKFDKTLLDLGIVNEKDSVSFFEFKITNISKQKVIIQNIIPSCDCTVPEWKKDSIAPKKSEFIKGGIQLHNRVGKLEKYLDVIVSSATELDTIRLNIKGNVTPKPKGPSVDFPTKIGGMRVVSQYLNLNKLLTNPEITNHSFVIYNDTTIDLTFKIVSVIPPHLKIKINPSILKPGEYGAIELEYNTKIKNDYGYVADYLEVETNESANKIKRFFISANIEEHFPPMTEEMLADAPKIAIDKLEYNFGSIRAGETPKCVFTLTNTGKNTLYIRKVKTSCGCTATELEKNTLSPNESTKVYVNFDSKDRVGSQQKSIYIFSNDPTNPTQLFTIKGYVNK